jgi:hypothetical protein
MVKTAEHLDFLTDEERSAMQPSERARGQARILARVAEDAFRFSNDPEVTIRTLQDARDRLEKMDDDTVRRLEKMVRKMSDATLLFPTRPVIEVPTLPLVPEEPKEMFTSTELFTFSNDGTIDPIEYIEPEKREEIVENPIGLDLAETIEPDVQDLHSQAEASEAKSGFAPEEWFRKTFGSEWWVTFGFAKKEDASPAAMIAKINTIVEIRKPNSEERMNAVLGAWFEGLQMRAFAAAHPEFGTVNGIPQIIVATRRKLIEYFKKPVEEKASIQSQKIDNKPFEEPAAPAPRPRPVPAPPTQRPIFAADLTRLDHEGLDQEPTKVTLDELTNFWTERLGLDKDLSQGLHGALNPKGTSHLTPDKKSAIEKLAKEISTHFPNGIDDETLALDPQRQVLMRKLTGRWYRMGGGGYELTRSPQTLRQILKERHGEASDEKVVATLFNTLAHIGSKLPKQESEPVAS